MDISKKLAMNALIQNLGKLLSVFLNLALVGYMARYLGVNGMGQYATAVRFVGFFGIIADLGLNVIIAGDIAAHPEREKETIRNGFTLRFFSSLAILLFGALFALIFPYDPVIKKGIFLVLPAFWFVLLHQIFTGIFQKSLRMDKMVIAEIVSRGFLIIGTMYLISLKSSLEMFFILLSLSNALWFLAVFAFAYRYAPIRFAFDAKIQAGLLRAAMPLAVINAFHLVYFNVDSLMISVMRGNEDVGIYHVSYKVFEMLFTMAVAFVTLFVPILSVGKKRPEYLKKTFQSIFDNVALLGLTAGMFGFFFAEDIVGILGGSAFSEAVIPLKILFAATIFMVFNVLFKHFFVVMEKQRKVIWIFVLAAAINVILNRIFIPRYGFIGAAATTLVSEIFVMVSSFTVLQAIDFSPDGKNLRKTMISQLLIAVVLMATLRFSLIPRMVIAICSFFVFVKMFRLPLSVEPDEIV